MPFVKQEKRPELDKIYDAMCEANIVADGDLNYVLYKYAKHELRFSYNNLKNFIAELRECGAQIRSDFLVPYERIKKQENGDV